MYSLIVNQIYNNGTRNIATLYVGVHNDDNMGLKGGTLLKDFLLLLLLFFFFLYKHIWTCS